MSSVVYQGDIKVSTVLLDTFRIVLVIFRTGDGLRFSLSFALKFVDCLRCKGEDGTGSWAKLRKLGDVLKRQDKSCDRVNLFTQYANIEIRVSRC